MPTYRVAKDNNYTRISNHYLRDESLSLDAKGLLTLMLSLPEDWDYSITGLTNFTSDGRVCVANTICELEEHGYIRRRQNRGENGAFAKNEYWIYEVPQTEETPNAENTEAGNTESTESECMDSTSDDSLDEYESAAVSDLNCDIAVESAQLPDEICMTEPAAVLPVSYPSLLVPTTELLSTEKPTSANPSAENLLAGKQAQQIKEIPKTEKQNTMRYDLMRTRARERVEYAVLRDEYPKELLDELISLIVEMEVCEGESMLIAGTMYPTELVKARMQMLNAECVRYVMDCLREVKPRIRNMKKYLMAALFNAPATIENFVDARVRHDVYGTTAIKSGRAV